MEDFELSDISKRVFAEARADMISSEQLVQALRRIRHDRTRGGILRKTDRTSIDKALYERWKGREIGKFVVPGTASRAVRTLLGCDDIMNEIHKYWTRSRWSMPHDDEYEFFCDHATSSVEIWSAVPAARSMRFFHVPVTEEPRPLLPNRHVPRFDREVCISKSEVNVRMSNDIHASPGEKFGGGVLENLRVSGGGTTRVALVELPFKVRVTRIHVRISAGLERGLSVVCCGYEEPLTTKEGTELLEGSSPELATAIPLGARPKMESDSGVWILSPSEQLVSAITIKFIVDTGMGGEVELVEVWGVREPTGIVEGAILRVGRNKVQTVQRWLHSIPKEELVEITAKPHILASALAAMDNDRHGIACLLVSSAMENEESVSDSPLMRLAKIASISGSKLLSDSLYRDPNNVVTLLTGGNWEQAMAEGCDPRLLQQTLGMATKRLIEAMRHDKETRAAEAGSASKSDGDLEAVMARIAVSSQVWKVVNVGLRAGGEVASEAVHFARVLCSTRQGVDYARKNGIFFELFDHKEFAPGQESLINWSDLIDSDPGFFSELAKLVGSDMMATETLRYRMNNTLLTILQIQEAVSDVSRIEAILLDSGLLAAVFRNISAFKLLHVLLSRVLIPISHQRRTLDLLFSFAFPIDGTPNEVLQSLLLVDVQREEEARYYIERLPFILATPCSSTLDKFLESLARYIPLLLEQKDVLTDAISGPSSSSNTRLNVANLFLHLVKAGAIQPAPEPSPSVPNNSPTPVSSKVIVGTTPVSSKFIVGTFPEFGTGEPMPGSQNSFSRFIPGQSPSKSPSKSTSKSTSDSKPPTTSSPPEKTSPKEQEEEESTPKPVSYLDRVAKAWNPNIVMNALRSSGMLRDLLSHMDKPLAPSILNLSKASDHWDVLETLLDILEVNEDPTVVEWIVWWLEKYPKVCLPLKCVFDAANARSRLVAIAHNPRIRTWNIPTDLPKTLPDDVRVSWLEENLHDEARAAIQRDMSAAIMKIFNTKTSKDPAKKTPQKEADEGYRY